MLPRNVPPMLRPAMVHWQPAGRRWIAKRQFARLAEAG